MLAKVAIGLRVFQFIFSVAVMGLAVTLVKAQVFGSAPVTTKYSTFSGGFGVFAAIAGAIGLFIDAIPDIANIALDGLSAIFFVAGGIAWSIGLQGITCANYADNETATKMIENPLMNLGKEDGYYGFWQGGGSGEDRANRLLSACKQGFSDQILQFVAFIFCLGLIGVGYVRMRRGGPTTSYV